MDNLMKPNIEKIKTLIKEQFCNDYRVMAKAIGVDTTTIYRVITKRTNGGTKFFSGLIKYCETNKLSYKDYIFLPGALLYSNEDSEPNT